MTYTTSNINQQHVIVTNVQPFSQRWYRVEAGIHPTGPSLVIRCHVARELRSYVGTLTEIVEKLQVSLVAILEGGAVAVAGISILRSFEVGGKSQEPACDALRPICMLNSDFSKKKDETCDRKRKRGKLTCMGKYHYTVASTA